jgi:hypothetical protein
LPRLIIHLGVQKTGTTSFQARLMQNADMLAHRMSVHTPLRGTPAQKMGRAGMNFSLDPDAEREQLLVQAIARVREEILPTGRNALISHENLPGAVLGNGPTRRLYPQIGRIIELLDAGFAPLVPEYVIYTREMAGWLESVHSQVVISDRYLGTFDEFLVEMADCGTWAELEERVRRQVGPLRLRVFRLEDEPDAERPGQQILRFAGLSEAELAALPGIERMNTRVPASAVEFVRQLNRSALDRGALRDAVGIVLENLPLFAKDGA